MPLKSILAAFSGDPASCSALRVALLLQKAHAAHVTGVVWHGPGPVAARHRPYLTRGVAQMLSEREQTATEMVRADFERRVAEAGDPARASFIDLHALEDFSLPERARAYDLVVMSRHAAEVGREHASARPDVVALRSGRPVIAVPDGYDGREPGRDVLLAWDGKRASARALGDLIHLIGVAGTLTVLTIAGKPSPEPEAGDDVMALIRRHGLRAERLIRPAGRGGVTAAILDAAAEVGAGLVAMGAYEHSKVSEDLLGGVTREILGRAKIPVLMSH
jgi:nucleotide-binding universal stress UspA family protein